MTFDKEVRQSNEQTKANPSSGDELDKEIRKDKPVKNGKIVDAGKIHAKITLRTNEDNDSEEAERGNS